MGLKIEKLFKIEAWWECLQLWQERTDSKTLPGCFAGNLFITNNIFIFCD